MGLRLKNWGTDGIKTLTERACQNYYYVYTIQHIIQYAIQYTIQYTIQHIIQYAIQYTIQYTSKSVNLVLSYCTIESHD